MARLREVARDAHADVRHSILRLRIRPDEGGLVSALRAYLQRFAHQEEPTAHVEAPAMAEGAQLSPAVEIQALRIVQQALSNVRKHAGVGEAWVEIGERDEGLELRIRDQGCGFDQDGMPTSNGHFGLQTMRERAEAAGGRSRIETVPGDGTLVEAWLPAAPTGG